MKSWVLTVFNVPDRLGGLARRLGLKQTQKNRNNWWCRFNPWEKKARKRAKRLLEGLNAAGLRDRRWMEVEAEDPRHPEPRFREADDGLRVIHTQITAENRLAQDALKLAIERRRQAEILAEREAARRAHNAVLRAKGEPEV